MKASYKKLWKILIDQDMKKGFRKSTGISYYTINKLNHGGNVATDVYSIKLYNDIMEFVDE